MDTAVTTGAVIMVVVGGVTRGVGELVGLVVTIAAGAAAPRGPRAVPVP